MPFYACFFTSAHSFPIPEIPPDVDMIIYSDMAHTNEFHNYYLTLSTVHNHTIIYTTISA